MNYPSIVMATVQTVALYYVGGYLFPLIGQMIALFTPVPLIIAYVRNGRLEGLTALGASTVIVTLLGGWQVAAILVLSFGLMAVGTAEGMRRRLKPEHLSLLGGLLPIIAVGTGLAFYLVHVGTNPLTVVDEYLRSSMKEAAQLYSSVGLTEMAAAVTSVSDTFIHYLARLLPGIIIAMTVTQAAFCYGIARAVIMRRPGTDAFLSAQPPLSSWHAPDTWVWGLIAALALLVIPDESAKLLGWNFAILFATLYLAQGIALVDYFLRKMQLRALGRGVVHTIILALPSIVFVITLGIVDVWADFRKVRGPEQKT
jgi:uncharacterized protein YybS (DUF2232 family)